MSKLKSFDSPWHVDCLQKKEDDPRRHKSRCKYYINDNCKLKNFKCIGSAHCMDYGESINNYSVLDNDEEKKYYRQNKSKKTKKRDFEIVQHFDIVGVYSKEDKCIYDFEINKDINKLPMVAQKCIGHKVADSFQIDGYNYSIRNIKKGNGKI